jgi:hypothetical protein
MMNRRRAFQTGGGVVLWVLFASFIFTFDVKMHFLIAILIGTVMGYIGAVIGGRVEERIG